MSKLTDGIKALPLGDSKYTSKSVRKIDNGYIVTEYNDTGCSERYVKNASDSPADPHGPNEHKGSLREAAMYLKGK